MSCVIEYCALCGELVPDPQYKWEGPTPRNGEDPERGSLCDPCGQQEDFRMAKAREAELTLDSMLGK